MRNSWHVNLVAGALVTALFHLGEMATATESLDEATFEVLMRTLPAGLPSEGWF